MEKIINAKTEFSFLGLSKFTRKIVVQLGFITYESGEAKIVRTKEIEVNDIKFITDILNYLELQRWEDIPRKFARIKIDTETNQVVALGHWMENKWINF